MCGRFTRTEDGNGLRDRFGFDEPVGVILEPAYNIAPSQDCPVITVKDDRRVLGMMRWGLVPPWSADAGTGYKMINARAETVSEKKSFKTPLAKTRCLVPASGFYEWKKTGGKTKTPYYFRLKGGAAFAFAGLWTVWHAGKEDELHTFTIITTGANGLMEPVHDRMLVILHVRDEARWLDPMLRETAEILPMLKPFPSEEMECYKVSTYVNSYRNQGPRCIKPAAG